MELKSRKNTRLKEYDYSSDGTYFITMCSKDRKPMFSTVGTTIGRPEKTLKTGDQWSPLQFHVS